MGKLALTAKITHVPSMYLSELPGKNHGCRQGAIDGHKEISKRCRSSADIAPLTIYCQKGRYIHHTRCRYPVKP